MTLPTLRWRAEPVQMVQDQSWTDLPIANSHICFRPGTRPVLDTELGRLGNVIVMPLIPSRQHIPLIECYL